MSASAEQTRAAMHALYGRPPVAIVADLRGVAIVLSREIERLPAVPSEAALVTISTSAEGIRRLMTQLRLALQANR